MSPVHGPRAYVPVVNPDADGDALVDALLCPRLGRHQVRVTDMA